MGLLGNPFADIALAPFTGGLSLVSMDGGLEDTASRIPGINELTGAESNEEKALRRKQKELAKALEQQRDAQQNSRMNALGQQLLAFNPRNQVMAQMFGPQAAFSPEAMAAMAQSPLPSPIEAAGIPTGTTLTPQQVQQQRAYLEAEERRKQMLMNGFQQPGPGPAPVGMPTPQAARRF